MRKTMYRLNVPYREKDIVKALGARWNPMGKFWYCEELTEDLKPWYQGAETSVPAAKKNRPAAGKSAPDLSDFIQEDLFFGTEAAVPEKSGQPALEEAAGTETEQSLPFFGEARYRTVSEINGLIADAFFATSLFRRILVKGEVTMEDCVVLLRRHLHEKQEGGASQ